MNKPIKYLHILFGKKRNSQCGEKATLPLIKSPIMQSFVSMNTLENQNLTLKEKIAQVINARLSSTALKTGYLSLKELASILNRHERTIRKWNEARKNGEDVGIPFYQLGDNSRYLLVLSLKNG